MFIRGVVGLERVTTPLALITLLEDLDYIKTWLRSHRCAIDKQIRAASQKSVMKQEDPVWKSL